MRSMLATAIATMMFVSPTAAQQEATPAGDWPLERSQAILEKTLTLSLKPDLTQLSAAERAALEKLIQAGQIIHQLYLEQRHQEAQQAAAWLAANEEQLGAAAADQLRKLFWIFKGPIATTLDNQRVPFLPVADEQPGKNIYPANVNKAELDLLMAEDPLLREELLAVRHLVRENTDENRERDRELMQLYPALGALHARFARRLAEIEEDRIPYYAVPYAIAYAKQIMELFVLLEDASDCVAEEDPDFAAFLSNRARDLISGNYEAGDASWVSGNFQHLNAQIGSYETYDDALYGVKAFYGMSILVRDKIRSDALAAAITDIQVIEDALPSDTHKAVRQRIPVNVYRVIADFGQSRGTNTATILPNDADHTRKYGRTILLRHNIMTHPALFQMTLEKFQTAMAAEFDDDLTLDAGFQRTLWHEVGHYLGVDKTADGRSLGDALQQYSDLLEEMKADLVSLFAAQQLTAAGHHTADELQAIYASGILRVLQIVEPRREQPYQTMQLMQWNYFLENGLLDFDAIRGELSINYDKYHEVVTNLLSQVLAIQSAGNVAEAAKFVEQLAHWDEQLHGVIAERLRAQTKYRYWYMRYDELDAAE